MPRERKQRGHRHAEKRKLEREEQEAEYLASQERTLLFHDRPMNPFGHLTREEEKYFFEVFDEFKRDSWEDEDAREAFVQNVFAEMKGKELKVATSQVGRFLELLLERIGRGDLQRILGVFKGHARELAKHRFGSFTLEKVSGHAGIWTTREIEGNIEIEEGVEQMESVEKLFLDLVEELVYTEMHEMFMDPFASHVYQAMIHTLTGHPRKNLGEGNGTKKRKKKYTEETTYQVPESFTNTLAKILKTVKEWELKLLQSLVLDKYAVPLMQVIAESDVVKKSKKKSKDKKEVGSATLSDIILFGNDADSKGQQGFIDQLLKDPVGSRILETIVRTTADETVQLLFSEYFKEHLYDLAVDPAANFVVQRILERLTDPDDISFCVSNLLGAHVDELIRVSKVSIITTVLDACSRTNTECDRARQEIQEAISKLPRARNNLWTTLMELDHLAAPEQPPLNPKKHPNAEDSTATPYPVSRFGALLAAAILRLPNPSPQSQLHEDLSTLETSAVLFYATHPQTSHVIEHMLSHQYPVPLRRKLLNHILGSTVKLATDAAGSHIIDACWGATQDIKHYRQKMAKEMALEEDTVRTDFFGRQVWKNWNMDGFVGERFDWGRDGEGEMGFAKRPEVKKKPWQRFTEKKALEGGKGMVKKHFSEVKS